MSSNRNIANDGQALTSFDVQRIGDIAASADDRVYENLLTPGSLAAKAIATTGIESATFNPRLLAVPGTVAGTIQVQPCILVAGSPSVAQKVALAATLQAALASAAFAANGGGATRYDLVYATVQRTVNLTGPRVIKSPSDGSLSTQAINLQDAPAVTLTILPNVGNVTPLATMPADSNGGAAGEPFGSYNFPIALVAVAAGYAGGGAITQAMITQMWNGGYVPAQRVRGARPASLYYGSAAEKPASSLTAGVQGAERWGSGGAQFFGHLKVLSSTGVTIAAGVVVDSTIDWRNRFVYGFYSVFAGSGAILPIESATAQVMAVPRSLIGTNPQTVIGTGVIPILWTGNGSTILLEQLTYQDSAVGGAYFVGLGINPAGNLVISRPPSGGGLTQAPYDATNGDVVVLVLFATDKLLTNG